jgi:hypothetical protein
LAASSSPDITTPERYRHFRLSRPVRRIRPIGQAGHDAPGPASVQRVSAYSPLRARQAVRHQSNAVLMMRCRHFPMGRVSRVVDTPFLAQDALSATAGVEPGGRERLLSVQDGRIRRLYRAEGFPIKMITRRAAPTRGAVAEGPAIAVTTLLQLARSEPASTDASHRRCPDRVCRRRDELAARGRSAVVVTSMATLSPYWASSTHYASR